MIRPRIVLIVALCLAVLCPAIARASPAKAASGPSIELSPSVGPPTTTVVVHGSGFGPKEAFTLSFGSGEVASGTTTRKGSFTASFDVPAPARPGEHKVKARGSPHESAKAAFLVRTDWPQFRYDQSHSGTNPYENILSPQNVGSLTVRWVHPLDDITQSSAAVVGGVVYIGDDFKTLYALDAATGEERWRYEVSGVTVRAPAVAGGIVYCASTNGIDALRASDGKFLWHFSAFDPDPVNVSGGLVYFGSYLGSVYAVDAVTGALRWRSPTGRVASSPAVADGVVYVGSDDAYVYAFDALTGKRLWRYQTGGFVRSSPSVADGVVYVGSHDDYLYALDATTGKKVWRLVAGSYMNSATAVADGVVYTGASGHIYAIDAATGEVIWDVPTPINLFSTPAVANGVVYIGDVAEDDGAVVALDAATGDRLWYYQPPTGRVDSSPVVVDGVLYVGSQSHNVYAFALPD